MFNIVLKPYFPFILLYLKKKSLIMHDFRAARVMLLLKDVMHFKVTKVLKKMKTYLFHIHHDLHMHYYSLFNDNLFSQHTCFVKFLI